VWFDALINYYSALKSHGTEGHYWPHVEHFIAKDILKPHGVFWPTMLKSAGLPLYQHLNVHGYWLVDGGKMSKSKGNVVRPLDLKDKYGNDAFRYYLLRDMSFGLDASFSEVGLAERINSDLANDLGNLLNRTLGMLGKYRQGMVPEAGDLESIDAALRDAFVTLPERLTLMVDNLQFDRVIESVLEAVRKANKYIAGNAAVGARQGRGERQAPRYRSLHLPRGAPLRQYPPLVHHPEQGRGVAGAARTRRRVHFERRQNVGPDPRRNPDKAGHAPFSPRGPDRPEREPRAEREPLEHKPEVTIDDFARLEFRVAEIIKAEAHPKADKLLVLSVKLGGEERTIVSGIKKWYDPERAGGKKGHHRGEPETRQAARGRVAGDDSGRRGRRGEPEHLGPRPGHRQRSEVR
jgi:methionyl-tRNA synthetase